MCHVKQLPQQTVNVQGQYLGFRDRLGQNFCKSVPENMALYKRILTPRDRRTDFYYLYSSKGKKYIFICIGRWAKIVLSLTYICIGCFCSLFRVFTGQTTPPLALWFRRVYTVYIMKLLLNLEGEALEALIKICAVTAKQRFDETGEIRSTPKTQAIRMALIEMAGTVDNLTTTTPHPSKSSQRAY